MCVCVIGGCLFVHVGNERVQEIGTVLWPDEDLVVFSGGSPLSLTDGHCVSILEGEAVHTLQLTSPVKCMLTSQLCVDHI